MNFRSRQTTLTGTNNYSEPSSKFESFDRDDPSRATATSSHIKESDKGKKAMFFSREMPIEKYKLIAHAVDVQFAMIMSSFYTEVSKVLYVK